MTGWFTSNHPKRLSRFLSLSNINVPIEVQQATMTGWFTSNHPKRLSSFLSLSNINVPIKSQPGRTIRLLTFHQAERVACRDSVSVSRTLVEVQLLSLDRLPDENKLRP